MSTARIKLFFWRRCWGDQDTLQGESPTSNLFTLFFSCFVLLYLLLCLLHLYQNTKKLVASFTLFTVLHFISKTQKISYLHLLYLPFVYFIMLRSKFTLKDIPVGRGSIIGRYNIEEFFTHVSTVKIFEDRSLVELAPTYEIATASLVHMLEARFVNLN